MKIKNRSDIKPAVAHTAGNQANPKRQQPTPVNEINSKANIKPALAHAAGTPRREQTKNSTPKIKSLPTTRAPRNQ
jgi:hypothetical protein